jgi:hypothetical protein
MKVMIGAMMTAMMRAMMKATIAAMMTAAIAAVVAAGVTMTLAAQAQPPTDGTLLGSVPALSQPVRTLKLTRGTGPGLVTFWTGYWTLTP